jgi:hypothetical protein
MIRKLKPLGLAAIAVLAIAAAVAQAAAPEFHTEVEPAALNGDQVVPLTFIEEAGFSFKCGTASFTGTLGTKTSTSITLEPVLAECKLFGGAAEHRTNGCAYVFKLVAASSPPTANVDITCPAGQKMEVESKIVDCLLTIGAQAGVKHATFANAGIDATRDTTINVTLTEIDYEEDGEDCISAGGHNDGSYTGTVTLKGYKDENGKKGAQIGLWVA